MNPALAARAQATFKNDPSGKGLYLPYRTMNKVAFSTCDTVHLKVLMQYQQTAHIILYWYHYTAADYTNCMVEAG